MNITLEEYSDMLLTSLIVDQAKLPGLLKNVSVLGMPLVSVHWVVLDETFHSRSKNEKE
jgi:hypothetical protein